MLTMGIQKAEKPGSGNPRKTAESHTAELIANDKIIFYSYMKV